LVFDVADEPERCLDLRFCLGDFLPDAVEFCPGESEAFDALGEVLECGLALRRPLGRGC